MENISVEQICIINKLCLKEGEKFSVLDENRLLSALSNQYAPYDSDGKTIASLYKALILDHAFENGNKRTAVILMAYLAQNANLNIKITDKELCSLTYQIADTGGSKIQVDYIYRKLFNKSKKCMALISLNDFVASFCKHHEWLIEKLGE